MYIQLYTPKEVFQGFKTLIQDMPIFTTGLLLFCLSLAIINSFLDDFSKLSSSLETTLY